MSDYLENAVLEAVLNATALSVTTPYISLHTANPGDAGADELTGGGYARQSQSFAAAASGDCSSDADCNFTNLTGTVVGFGIWDASTAGNLLYWDFLGNFDPIPFISDNPAGDTLTAPNHGLTDNDRVVVSAEFGGTLPTGLTAGTVYHVVGSATDTFQVSLTQGGAAVTITADGEGFWREVTTKTLAADDFKIASGNLTVKQR